MIICILFYTWVETFFLEQELLLATVFIFCIATSNIGFGDASKPFNVLSFGAVGDGKTDDSPVNTLILIFLFLSKKKKKLSFLINEEENFH